MADEADDAQALSDFYVQQRRQAMAREKTGLAPKGVCHNPACEAELEPVVEGGVEVHKRLFCDSVCASDYEKYKKVR